MITIHSVPGWPGYGVSVDGKVWSRRRKGSKSYDHPWKELKLRVSDTGYLNLSPTRDGKSYTLYAHIWIALVFLGPRPRGMEINHKDGNKLNCAAHNLEYVTPSQNVNHAYATGLQPKRNWSAASKQKARDAAKKQWKDPEFRQRTLAALQRSKV